MLQTITEDQSNNKINYYEDDYEPQYDESDYTYTYTYTYTYYNKNLF
jgi:hypothetical protein